MNPPSFLRSVLITFFCLLSGSLAAAEAETPRLIATFDWRAFLAPFHTVTLHLPIGFVTMAVILEIYSLFRPSEALRRTIALVLWVSGFSAVIVTVLGFFRASGGGYEQEMLEHHERFGVAVSALTMVIAVIHLIAYPREKSRKVIVGLYRLLLVSDVVLLSIAGHGGGNLTHGSKYLVEGAPEWVKEWVAQREGKPTTDQGAGVIDEFTINIQPIFEKKCYGCHGPEKQKGDYRMDTVEGLFKAGESELDPITKGRPMESYLVELITLPADDEFAMPPDGKERLTPDEVLTIMHWIFEGAETGSKP
ncbi:MAG: hypothetical protein KDN20_03370 [Verrucomicrobiae bacterium]|nr:hypothetical protein [Verrucomicrobiae bacterium]